VSDLHVCRLMGWTYDELLGLPQEIYTVLIETLNAETHRRDRD
jgi:hypothetical protein